MQIALAGASGRMGRCILELVGQHAEHQVVAALTYSNDPDLGSALNCGRDELLLADRLGVPCDVLIDFSTASGTIDWLGVCERMVVPMVIGVTGYNDEQTRRIQEGARAIPVFLASNFSVGMWVLRQTVQTVAKKLGTAYDVEIVETHHNKKVDAPSGSAMALVESIAAVRNSNTPADVVHGRSGQVGARPVGQIGMHSVRMGDIVGHHEVHFAGVGEVVTVSHRVGSRETFAAGAVRAAEWLLEQRPGLFGMDDMLRQDG